MKHKDGSADKYKDKHKEKRKEEKVTYFVEDKVWGMLCLQFSNTLCWTV